MKYPLVAFSLLFSTPVMAQQNTPSSANDRAVGPMPAVGIEATVPFKGANVLLLHTSDSAATALKNLGRLLVKSGYTLDKLDMQLGYLTTIEPSAGSFHTSYAYKAIAESAKQGVTLIVTGRFIYMTGFATVKNGPVVVGKGNAGAGFDAIERILLTYPGGRVGYAQDGKPETKTTLVDR